MIGKILLCVFGVLFLFLLIALRIPAYVRISYEQGQLCSFIKYVWMTIPLYPKKKEETQKNIMESHHTKLADKLKEKRKKDNK